MFRVISEFLPTGASPYYLVICDDPRCAMSFQAPVPLDDTINPEAKAVREAQSVGWLMSIGRQICPAHFQQLRDIESAGLGKRRIVQPGDLRLVDGRITQ